MVAEMMRASVLIRALEPSASNFCSDNTRSSLTWALGGIDSISSKNNVPPRAYSNFPCLFSNAPVNAPLTCPNSSDSNRSLGIAPQLMGTKWPLCLLPNSCRQPATTSLPEPVSPWSSTGTSSRAMANISSLRRETQADSPRMREAMPFLACSLAVNERLASVSRRLLIALVTLSTRRSGAKGFSIKS